MNEETNNQEWQKRFKNESTHFPTDFGGNDFIPTSKAIWFAEDLLDTQKAEFKAVLEGLKCQKYTNLGKQSWEDGFNVAVDSINQKINQEIEKL